MRGSRGGAGSRDARGSRATSGRSTAALPNGPDAPGEVLAEGAAQVERAHAACEVAVAEEVAAEHLRRVRRPRPGQAGVERKRAHAVRDPRRVDRVQDAGLRRGLRAPRRRSGTGEYKEKCGEKATQSWPLLRHAAGMVELRTPAVPRSGDRPHRCRASRPCTAGGRDDQHERDDRAEDDDPRDSAETGDVHARAWADLERARCAVDGRVEIRSLLPAGLRAAIRRKKHGVLSTVCKLSCS